MQGITFKANAAIVTRDLKVDFGAEGNGLDDALSVQKNTDAFIKAGIFFSNFLAPGDEGILMIPSTYQGQNAVYYVGKQIPTGQSYTVTCTDIMPGATITSSVTRTFASGDALFAGFIDGMLYIENTKNKNIKIRIQGSDAQNPPLIKYVDGLYFGSFIKPWYTYKSYQFCTGTQCGYSAQAVINQNESNIPAVSCLCQPPSNCGCPPPLFLGSPVVQYQYTNNTLNIEPMPQAGWNYDNSDEKTKAWIGHFIGIYKSDDVTIKHLRIDGNNTHFNWGGTYGDRGIQLPHTGISCKESSHISIDDVKVNNMGFDGILIDDGTDNVLINNTHCIANTRGGLSWTGGIGLTATHCHFNESGKGTYNPTLSNPGTGLDIEPDIPDVCSSGLFIDCHFNNNNGPAISNNQYGVDYTDDMKFNDCEMYSNREIGLFCTGRRFIFDHCDIYARVVWSSVCTTKTDGMVYRNCSFEDKPYNNTEYWPPNLHLIDIPGNYNVQTPMKYTLFDYCDFRVNDDDREMFRIYSLGPGLVPSGDYTTFNHCEFVYDNDGNTTNYGNNIKSSILSGVLFTGNNKIVNNNINPTSKHEWSMNSIEIEGSVDPCAPFKFEVEGNVMLSQIAWYPNMLLLGRHGGSNDATGYLKATFKQNAILNFPNNITLLGAAANITIGENSSLVIEPSSSILANGYPALNTLGYEFNMHGQLILKENSYFTFHAFKFFKHPLTPQKSLFYIDNQAVADASPYWFPTPQGIPVMSAYDPNNAPCIQGGNTAITNPIFVCSPPYTNISTQGSFSVMYNITNNICYGGSTGNIAYQITGGVTPYNVLLNGIVTNNNPITGLVAGTYTMAVTDNNGCINQFEFTITQPTQIAVTASATTISCNGAISTLSATGSGGTPSYSYSMNGGAYQAGNTFNTQAGTFTITIKDVNNCTANTVINVTQPSAIAFTNSSFVSPLCYGLSNGSITINATGGTGMLAYSINPNANQPTAGNFTGLSAQVYTITATDVNNCTVTTIINVTQPPLLVWSTTSFTNITCSSPLANDGSISVQASGGTGTITYILDYPGGQLQNTNGIFSPIVAHSYTVTAKDVNNCTVSTIIELIDPNTGNFCCSPQAQNLIANTPNVILKIAPQASDLVSQYGNVITGKTFYIDDVFTIDDDITFNGCTLWFTQTGSIQLTQNFDITIENGSVLKASCEFWSGIFASDPQNKVTINQSSIQQMQAGIYIFNNAVIEAISSTFSNNDNRSILFSEITDINYGGIIKDNIFIGDININNNIPLHGIEIENSSNIKIGDLNNAGSFNTFKNLQNGIDIRGWGNIAGILGTNSNQIGIYNNKFEDILYPGNQPTYNFIMQDIYNSPKGSAVYIDYSTAPSFDAHTTVSYTGLTTSTTELIKNCTKAIVSKNNSLNAEKLFIMNCDFGIMNHNLMSKVVNVIDNKIDNAHIGTQLAGNYTNYNVYHNDITINQGVEVSNAGYGMMAMMYPAIGIDIKQMNQPFIAAQSHTVDLNTIKIPYYAGKGIANQGTNGSEKVKNNTILFTVAQGTAYPVLPYHDPSLYGVYNSNCKDFTLDNNLVDGQYSNGVYNTTYSKAYYFETCDEMIVSCNKARATKQGLYAWGTINTSPHKIHHNKFKYNLNPLYTLDAGNMTQGTFGNIGGLNGYDNKNEWLYNTNNKTYLQNQWFKIWRNSTTTTPNFIKTIPSLLDMNQGESGSPAANQYKYGVDNIGINPVTEVCTLDPLFDNSNPPVTVITAGGSDVDYAETIALQNETYINFLQVGEWLNNRWLFDRLTEDESLRNSSAILTAFYNNYENTTIGNIEQADLALNTLFDFTGSENDLIVLYNEALTRNNEIVSTESHEINEKIINEIALRMTRYGIDSVSEVQKLELELLANTCPFVGGSAVYKARILWAIYNPMAQYNDRLICLQNVGQNKNGFGGYVNLDSLYEAQVNEDATKLANQLGLSNMVSQNEIRVNGLDNFEDIVLYPNPANDYINISNNGKAGEFCLYDGIGRRVLKQTLNNSNTITKISLPKLSNGLYNYKILMDNGTYTGKINIRQYE